MTTIEIFERGITKEIPSSWDEMTPAQICFVMQTYDYCIRKEKSPLEFNIRVLYYLLGIKHNWRSVYWEHLHPELVEDRNANIYMLCEKCLGFLFEEGKSMNMQLSFSAINNPLPTIRSKWFRRKLIGPADLLQNLTYGEFRHATTALNDFFKSNKIEDLDECIAFLYRPRSKRPNRAGRYVAAVDNSTFSRDVRRVRDIPFWRKNLIMLWFAACINYLQTGVVIIDGEEIDMSRLFSNPDQKSDHAFTWNDVLIQIAKDQIVGSMERVDEESLFTIFGIIWHNYKEGKRDEKARKTH